MRYTALLFAAARAGALGLVFVGSSVSADNEQFAWISKHDRGIQCEREGVAVKEMEKELTGSGIEVFCGAKVGFVVAAVCKGPTGTDNVYAIRSRDLPRAQALGFGVFPNDGRYGHPSPICTPIGKP
ncbi:hypothetical protein [Pseudorhodoferax sp.]|uniref:hypothetical protein n=1 Tax=Pseudorhodoferax sp. TaxID=1993553 RepID=UPI002DD67C29|nr:hypothetical protein [Pseudorhodoferax sp.]